VGDSGPSARPVQALWAKHHAGPQSVKPNQLARSLMLSSGGATNVTHRLVSRGLIVRVGDPADARGTWLRLTPEGVKLAERAVRANAAAHDALFRDMPSAVVEAATGANQAR
jgi:DNA-binding MarR family transcriptional regulator